MVFQLFSFTEANWHDILFRIVINTLFAFHNSTSKGRIKYTALKTFFYPKFVNWMIFSSFLGILRYISFH